MHRSDLATQCEGLPILAMSQRPVDLKRFELVLSHRPENASANPDDVLRTQDEYLADHARLRGVGHVVTTARSAISPTRPCAG